VQKLLKKKPYERISVREALRHHWLNQDHTSPIPLSGLTIKLSFKAHQAIAKMMCMLIVEKELECKVVQRDALSLVQVIEKEIKKDHRVSRSIKLDPQTRKNGSLNNFQIKTFHYAEGHNSRHEFNPKTAKIQNNHDSSKVFLPYFNKNQSRQIRHSLVKQPKTNFKLNKTKFFYLDNLSK